MDNADSDVRENGQKLLEFVEAKNPGITRKSLGGDEKMASILMDVLKPEIDERVNNERADERRTNLFVYVQDGDMMLDRAARRAGMSITDFSNAMATAGYIVPQSTAH